MNDYDDDDDDDGDDEYRCALSVGKPCYATGAPDPTAGGALDDDNSWHLDEEQVQKLVKNYLSQGIYCNHNEHLSSIFDKVNFMLRSCM